jgi:hypothetical protein
VGIMGCVGFGTPRPARNAVSLGSLINVVILGYASLHRGELQDRELPNGSCADLSRREGKTRESVEYWLSYPLMIACPTCGLTYDYSDSESKGENLCHNVVIPFQFAHLLVQYQAHPEAKSLSPNGMPCKTDTHGLLRRAHIVAGDLRYIGKEANLKWGEGDDPSVSEFKSTEYGRTAKVAASDDVKIAIRRIGINKCARESGFDRKNFIRKLVRGLPAHRPLLTNRPPVYRQFREILDEVVVVVVHIVP